MNTQNQDYDTSLAISKTFTVSSQHLGCRARGLFEILSSDGCQIHIATTNMGWQSVIAAQKIVQL
jgi:hypothetical protein